MIGLGNHSGKVISSALFVLTLLRVQELILLTWLTLFPAWTRNHMSSKVWDGIIYPFPNFNGCTISFRPTLHNGCNYFYMVGLMSIHFSKRDNWCWNRKYSGLLCQCQSYWCPGSFCGQVIIITVLTVRGKFTGLRRTSCITALLKNLNLLINIKC